MQTSATVVANSVSTYFSGLTEEAKFRLLENEIDNKSREGGYRILVFDDCCRVVVDTNRGTVRSEEGNTMLVPEVIRALTRKNEAGMRKDEKAIYAAASIDNENAQKIGAILLVASAEDIFTALASIRQTILLYSVLVGLLVTVLAFFVSQFLLQPLSGILKVVRKMADGHLNQRIEVKNLDEYSQLADSFNNMTDKLEQVEKTREEFVSNVSHELKTPLSSMKVLSESLLLQGDVPAEMYREFLQDITSEVDRMTNIINDLLSLVKIDQREQGLNIQPIELNSMVEDILKRMSPLAEQRKIVLLYEDVRTVTIDADEMKMSLAISNIVVNGIKYTPPGGTVKVIVDADHQNAFITVQDTGIGIQEEEQSKIFNRFYRIDKTRDRETGGTGLGLAISHSTVLLHNGSIRLTSKIDEGTVFVVRLPIRRS